MPRSPWLASPGWTKNAGAAGAGGRGDLAAVMPDLPMPSDHGAPPCMPACAGDAATNARRRSACRSKRAQ